MKKTALNLVNVSKSYTQADQKIEIIKNFNFVLEQKELVALTGYSGSGKTTLLQIAGLLDIPTSGQVFINEIEASNSNDQIRTTIRKNNIGFVYQFHHLLPEFSALENVALPLLIRGENKKDARDKAKKILDEVELSNRIHHHPFELSGGQQQRVALARAIVAKPSLILADEPTGNLDAELSEKIFSILVKLVKNYEISCLVVTHNAELAKKADRIVLLK